MRTPQPPASRQPRRWWRRLFDDERGAVQMEYVILAVLIAAACVMAVVVFGRAIVSSFITASEGTTLQHTKARDDLQMRRSDRRDDMDKAREYHDSLHQ